MNKKKVIVIENDSIYADILGRMLAKNNFDFDVAKDIYSINILLEEGRYALALVDFAFVKNKEFNILGRLRTNLKIPIIITTEKEIDDSIDFIVKNDINMVLNKPFKTSELINVIEKMLYPRVENCFGIENYVERLRQLKKIEITKSVQIRSTIKTVQKQLMEWGFDFQLKFEMDLVWQELIINAVYHSHGFTEQKEQRKPIQLPDPYKVIVRYGCNEEQFAFSVKDFMGSLSPEKILRSLQKAIHNQKEMEKAFAEGQDFIEHVELSGRGIDLVRKMAGEYYFIIQPGRATEVIIVYDRNYEKDDAFSSIKIIELD